MTDHQYEDDQTIHDECFLLRRVINKPDFYIIWDDIRSRWRPSSAAFQDHPNGSDMSVVLGCLLDETGRVYEEVLDGHDDFSLVAFTAQIARENGQRVARDPLPDEPAHGLVIGNKKKASKKIARAANWVVAPPDPDSDL